MRKSFLILIILLIRIPGLNAQVSDLQKERSQTEIWRALKPAFSPPREYKNEFGAYTSILNFYSGAPVTKKTDWKKRRAEILQYWHNAMGHWPELLTTQKLEIIDTVVKAGYKQHRVRFNWTPNERTEGYLLVPDRKGKKPAVITVYYEPESAVGNGVRDRDFASQLAMRGFVTLSIGTTETSKAKTYSIYYPNIKNATLQPLSALAYAAANAWYALSKVDQVDSTRIGIMGHSYGGKWAMFASCLFEKFACAVWSDPGIVFDESKPAVNYWEPWYLGYSPGRVWRKQGIITSENPADGPYPQLVAKKHDLHELHALMAPRPFLVSGGSEDPIKRWVPLNHTIKVNSFLGYKNRVAMTNRPKHAPDAVSKEQAYMFFEYVLKK